MNLNCLFAGRWWLPLAVAGASMLPIATASAQTSYTLDDDSWYEVTEWFDGNDFNYESNTYDSFYDDSDSSYYDGHYDDSYYDSDGSYEYYEDGWLEDQDDWSNIGWNDYGYDAGWNEGYDDYGYDDWGY